MVPSHVPSTELPKLFVIEKAEVLKASSHSLPLCSAAYSRLTHATRSPSSTTSPVNCTA